MLVEVSWFKIWGTFPGHIVDTWHASWIKSILPGGFQSQTAIVSGCLCFEDPSRLVLSRFWFSGRLQRSLLWQLVETAWWRLASTPLDKMLYHNPRMAVVQSLSIRQSKRFCSWGLVWDLTFDPDPWSPLLPWPAISPNSRTHLKFRFPLALKIESQCPLRKRFRSNQSIQLERASLVPFLQHLNIIVLAMCSKQYLRSGMSCCPCCVGLWMLTLGN